MKQKLILFLMVLALTLQPFSINFDSGSVSADSTIKENGACSQNTDMKVKETGALKDEKVLKEVKSSLHEEWKNNKSIHKQGEFDWNNSEFVSFGEEKDGFMVPAKKNNTEKDVRLITVYDKQTGEVEDFTLMVATLNGAEMEVVYTTLLDEEIVGMEIDTQTNEIEDTKVYGEKEGFSLVSQNKASAGWASDTVDCLKNKWKTANGFTKLVCTGACSSVVFGGNVIGATVCASCLGAYAMFCTIH